MACTSPAAGTMEKLVYLFRSQTQSQEETISRLNYGIPRMVFALSRLLSIHQQSRDWNSHRTDSLLSPVHWTAPFVLLTSCDIETFERTHLLLPCNSPVLLWILLVKWFVPEVLIHSISLFGQSKPANYLM